MAYLLDNYQEKLQKNSSSLVNIEVIDQRGNLLLNFHKFIIYLS